MGTKKPLLSRSERRWTGFVAALRNGEFSGETGLRFGFRMEFLTSNSYGRLLG
jgi:hypothetical protein